DPRLAASNPHGAGAGAALFAARDGLRLAPWGGQACPANAGRSVPATCDAAGRGPAARGVLTSAGSSPPARRGRRRGGGARARCLGKGAWGGLRGAWRGICWAGAIAGKAPPAAIGAARRASLGVRPKAWPRTCRVGPAETASKSVRITIAETRLRKSLAAPTI